MARPGGVTVIAVIEFLGGALCVLFGLGAITGAGFVSSVLRSQGSAAGMSSLMANIGTGFAVTCFVIAAILVLLGWGLLSLKEWARLVVMVLAGVSAVFTVIGMAQFGSSMMTSGILRLVIDVLIIWYLMIPRVRGAFKAS